MEGFLRYEFRGLIFGGVYFWNFSSFIGNKDALLPLLTK